PADPGHHPRRPHQRRDGRPGARPHRAGASRGDDLLTLARRPRSSETTALSFRRFHVGSDRALSAEMLRQLEALRLVVGADAFAVERVRARQHLLVDEAADDLAVLENERHFARTHLEHGAGAAAAGAGIAEAGI